MPIIEDTVSFLRTIPPFQFLNEEGLNTVAASMTIEFYPRGEVILKQDAPASDALRIIKKGAVSIAVRTESGDDVTIDQRSEGDTFGLISLMGQDRQKTTVVAMEDTVCFLLARDKIRSLIEANPLFTEYFLQTHFSKYMDKVYREMHSKSLFTGSSDHLLFTTPVGDIAANGVVTVSDASSIRDAAMEMSKNRAGSIIVSDTTGVPVGMVTDRDLREKVVARGRSVNDPVRDIMTLPLIRVDAKDSCFEAVLKMIKHNVHHILVIRDGKLKGVLSNHDLMLLQGSSPLSLAKDLESQDTIDGLAPVSRKINGIVGLLLKEGARASSIARIMTELNDRLVRKVLEITERKIGRAPAAYCWISFGSAGRKEQTFKTDQDNALIYADQAAPEKDDAVRNYFNAFAVQVRDGLVTCGYPRPLYPLSGDLSRCQPLSLWKKTFTGWMNQTTSDSILQSRAFFDFRPLHGDESLAVELRTFIMNYLKGRSSVLDRIAMAIMKNRPPLGFFRTFIVEKDGEHSNELNLSVRGSSPLIDMVRLMALEAGVIETSTQERIEAMKGKHPTVDAMADDIVQAFEFIGMLMTLHQVEQMEHGAASDDFINPSRLTKLEKSMLKESFQVITRLQAALASASAPA